MCHYVFIQVQNISFYQLNVSHKAYSWEQTCWNISCPNVKKELGDTAAQNWESGKLFEVYGKRLVFLLFILNLHSTVFTSHILLLFFCALLKDSSRNGGTAIPGRMPMMIDKQTETLVRKYDYPHVQLDIVRAEIYNPLTQHYVIWRAHIDGGMVYIYSTRSSTPFIKPMCF